MGKNVAFGLGATAFLPHDMSFFMLIPTGGEKHMKQRTLFLKTEKRLNSILLNIHPEDLIKVELLDN